MKLIGKDLSAKALVDRLEERLRARGLLPSPDLEQDLDEEGVEPRIDPLSFNLGALEEHADPTAPMPLHTHRGGLGQAVVLAKWAFRKSCQIFINETLARQRVFNGHVRDSYAELSAEVLKLRAEVEALKQAAPEARPPRPARKGPRRN